MITLILFLSVLFSADVPDISGSNAPAGNAELLAADNSFNRSDCTCKGIPLKGKVKIVNSYADFKVKVEHNSWYDLKVKVVTHFPDGCGKWQFVDSYPDFTIQFVDSYYDFTIKFDDHFPGTN